MKALSIISLLLVGWAGPRSTESLRIKRFHTFEKYPVQEYGDYYEDYYDDYYEDYYDDYYYGDYYFDEYEDYEGGGVHVHQGRDFFNPSIIDDVSSLITKIIDTGKGAVDQGVSAVKGIVDQIVGR